MVLQDRKITIKEITDATGHNLGTIDSILYDQNNDLVVNKITVRLLGVTSVL